jgi:hypothetical protein
VDWDSRLNKRDQFSFADQFRANASAQLELVPGLAAYASVGVAVPVNKNTIENVKSATVQGPVAFGAELAPVKPIALGAQLNFPNLIGDGATADFRNLVAYARIWL